jgi:CheY-like chemotaxis protein
LIIEDNPLVQQGEIRALQHAGFNVTAVGDALAALAAVKSHIFDAILCDINLPLVDGQTLYEQLAEDHPSLSNRVIFVTAMVNDPRVGAFPERAGRPVVAKPFDVDHLIAVVRSVTRDLRPDQAVLGVPPPDRDLARALPAEFLATTGSPRERITRLVERHWPSAPDADRRQLEQMLLVVFEPLARDPTITDEVQRQCEEAVVGWGLRQ